MTGPMGYRCPKCHFVSYNPHDALYKYCGRCKEFEDDRERRAMLKDAIERDATLDKEQLSEAIHEKVRAISPHLYGQSPMMQAAILADLVAMLLIGFPNFKRDEVFTEFCKLVTDLVPINVGLRYGIEGHPFDRKDS
jgi:hypothetical protein